MTDHPQTATERFLRHGVAGGWRYHNHKEIHFFDGSHLGVAPAIQVEYHDGYREKVLVQVFLLDPALWEAAGRSLGWADTHEWEAEDNHGNYQQFSEHVWKIRWHSLLDHLAAHPGDVEGYLAQIIGGKENE